MKAVLVGLAVLAGMLTAPRSISLAQDTAGQDSPTNTSGLFQAGLNYRVIGTGETPKQGVYGPAVEVFSGGRAAEIPKRFLRQFNPLAPMQTRQTAHRVGVRKYSAQAWSTLVGWNPGRSAFLDERTHEASLVLVSFAPARARP